MAKELRCADVGFFPDCPGVMRGETDEEFWADVDRHGREAHKWWDRMAAIRMRVQPRFKKDVEQRVRAAIREV
jgi:predicted small metal-binding protein